MKQKSFTILLAILMSIAANVAWAYDAEIDGIYYEFSGTEATVTSGPNHYYGNVVIPQRITYNNLIYDVTSIGFAAFFSCYNLTAITIPDGLITIESQAFDYCEALTSITIPKSVKKMNGNVFSHCIKLSSISVEEGNTAYDSRNECNAIIETATNKLVTGCKNTIIPNNVTVIGDWAFARCYGLTSIIIPEGVTNIGRGAFEDCSGLMTITIPESVTEFGSAVFFGCEKLTSINIPNSVTSIGNQIFNGCSSLSSITIPENVSYIGDWIFDGCTSLVSIVVKEGNAVYDSRNNCNAIIETSSNTLIAGCKNTSIPNSVTRIGDKAFYHCTALTSVTIPESVTSIGGAAFEGCSSLTTIIVKEENTKYDSRNNCNAIIETSSNTLIIGCKNSTIHSSVTTIGEFAFTDCSGLTSITIPNSVTSIGYGAFYGCNGLNSITIPNSVTSIGDYAFKGCVGLTTITIGTGVTNIGDRAFIYCSGLTDVFCYAKTVPITNTNAFNHTPSNMTLHVLPASINAYKTTAPWNVFKEIVESDYLNVADLNIKAGESNTQEISLNNGLTNLVGFQMDLTLPEGVSIDKAGCALSSRITDNEQELTIGKLESGAYRITSTSLSLIPISGNDGTLLGLKLTAEDGCIGGQATISNIIFSTAESEKVVMSDKTFDISILYNLTYKVDGEEYKTSSVAYGTALTAEEEPTKEGYTFGGWSEIPETMPNHDVEITGRFYLYGDVNTDEDVDVVDVVDIARFVVATPSVSFREKLADLNKDNTVNIADAVTLVNHIAGDQNFARAMEPSKTYNYDLCQLQLQSTQGNALSLCLDGDVDFTAFQFDVELPQGVDITAMRINGLRMNDHQILYNKVADNRYRVAVLSLSNVVFKGDEGELLNISIEGQPTNEISIHDILFVTKNGTAITFDDISLSEVTGISNVDANEGNNVVFDLQGRKLSKAQRGVNIVNGKKVVMK